MRGRYGITDTRAKPTHIRTPPMIITNRYEVLFNTSDTKGPAATRNNRESARKGY